MACCSMSVGDQCAWETVDMLKSGTRTGGITVRVSQSFHSRGRVCSLRPASEILPSKEIGD